MKRPKVVRVGRLPAGPMADRRTHRLKTRQARLRFELRVEGER